MYIRQNAHTSGFKNNFILTLIETNLNVFVSELIFTYKHMIK
jgi:hypothetical protein